jgi:hypothetical protein
LASSASSAKGLLLIDELAAHRAVHSVRLGDHRADHPAQDHFLAADRGEHPRPLKRWPRSAPQMAALKEKYKDDPTKFSQKQMEFFRENKINPVAGCLPMLVQLPVFFGLFMMLRTAIELRGASFLWAADLCPRPTRSS